MKDVLDIIADVLEDDNFIQEKAYGRIKLYEYPEVDEVHDPKIIISPVDSETPADYADNVWMTYDSLLQIEVWTTNRKDCKDIADRIRDIMWDELGFHQKAGPKEYDSGVFRDARRYRGKIYREYEGSI